MEKRLSKTQTIALGFFVIILIGTLLLMLPISTKSGESIGFHNALFTATSATCVTGLIIADTFRTWSYFGQVIIITLIQIGGLGFITLGVFLTVFLRQRVGLRERNLVQESLNAMQLSGAVRLVKKAVAYTLLTEGIGAVVLTIRFIPEFGVIKGIWYGIFHSISAFCNAGFDLMGEKAPYSSLVNYYDDITINITVMMLIIIGGIGFIVLDDVFKHKFHVKKYMLHTKIVLFLTCILILAGAVLFFLFERDNLLKDMSVKGQILSSLFASVSPRTAGFNTLDTAKFTQASMLLNVVLMFIGGSPGSTAGGIKTTTLMVLLLFAWSNLRNTRGMNIFHRSLPDDSIKKASTVFLINLFLATSAVMALCAIQPLPLADVMVEVFSAIGTVGMSTGITRELLLPAKYILILLMYCGRIGSMSFALSFMERMKVAPVKFPKEQITIG